MDGAFFGTTFPHLLLMTYPGMRPQLPVDRYVPRVFGFKLSAAALAPPAAEPQRNDAAASQASRVKPVLAFRCRALFPIIWMLNAVVYGSLLLCDRVTSKCRNVLTCRSRLEQ